MRGGASRRPADAPARRRRPPPSTNRTPTTSPASTIPLRNEKTKAVGIRSVPEDAKGRYRLRSQPNGVSYLVDGKRFFAHHGVTLEKAQGFAVEDFGGGVVGFRFEGGAEKVGEPPAAEKVERKAPATRRKAPRS